MLCSIILINFFFIDEQLLGGRWSVIEIGIDRAEKGVRYNVIAIDNNQTKNVTEAEICELNNE